jgi:glycosyltransferase involved in cell wall biosynthesis
MQRNFNECYDHELLISVVIVAKDAQKTIGQALTSVFNNTRKPDETIVVVDDLQDPTLKALDSYPVKVIINKFKGIGGARKVGVEASKGDIIIFIDADSTAHPNLIEEFEKAFHENPDVKVQAASLADDPYINEQDTLEYAPAMRLAFRKHVIDLVGNFDENLKMGWEDIDFCLRCGKEKIKIYCNKRAIIFHHANNARVVLKKAARDGGCLAQTSLKHGLRVISCTGTSILFLHCGLIHVAIISAIVIGLNLYTLSPLLLSLTLRFCRFILKLLRERKTSRIRSTHTYSPIKTTKYTAIHLLSKTIKSFIVNYMKYFFFTYGFFIACLTILMKKFRMQK